MTDAPSSEPVSAQKFFDAALARGRAAMAEPLPVLKTLDPEKTTSRSMSELRGLIASRLSFVVPVSTASKLHGNSVKELGRLERRFYWRWLRLLVSTFLLRYGLIIVGLLLLVGLLLAIAIYQEEIANYISELAQKIPSSTAPAATPTGSLGSAQGSNAMPLPSSSSEITQ